MLAVLWNFDCKPVIKVLICLIYLVRQNSADRAIVICFILPLQSGGDKMDDMTALALFI